MIKARFTTRNSQRLRSHSQRHRLQWWLLLALSGLANIAFGECEQAAGWLESHEGTVRIEQAGTWQPLAIGACVPAGARVQVSGGRAVFRLANETLLRASGTTLLRFAEPEQKNWIQLLDGALHFITRTPHAFDVQTDYVNAGVKGTEFILTANHIERSSTLTMLEGEVVASNAHGQQNVRSGAAIIARSGEAPKLLTVPALRDAVQWTLYYPPLPSTVPAHLQPALDRFKRNDAAGAIAQLNEFPATGRDADYYALVSAIDLQRGEIDSARTTLDRALALQPEHPQALALSAIHAVVVGDIERAETQLAVAQARAPRDAAVLIAKSYFEQAQHRLPAALAHAQAAAAVDQSALIQARVAELALMNGNTKLARQATKSALTQQPDNARANAIDGFVHLQQLRFDSAEAAFRRAITLDATDSLPRLGLGLIEIRHNHVSNGREQLAIAVALDPGQSLLRSYLGKAYQQEERERLASDQYALAKTLDAADPTPWFYSALLARVQNRPFDALDDLNQSIALNGNRAVYRSRLQLDADEATRTASQSDIYRELGFDALAQRSAAKAVSTAPSEYGGHRALAESYADNPQYDAARASEVLQAQLLQPLSATPLLPLLGETNLLAAEGAGPSALGFREYNAMFVREKPWLSIAGVGGSNDLGAGEATLSGIVDRFSYAISQYHYETLGHRDNNDARYDVSSAYGKYQANESLSFLLSASRKKEDRGNIDEMILGDMSELFFQVEKTTTSVLWGSHFAAAPQVDLLAALNYQEGDFDQLIRAPFFASTFTTTVDQKPRTSNAELQGQFGNVPGHLTVGVDWAETEGRSILRSETDDPALAPFLNGQIAIDEVTTYRTGYGYWLFSPISAIEMTMGVNYAELDADGLPKKLSGWYPKLSLTYQIHPAVDLRAAYFQSLTRPTDIEQTLEPTTIGGFNQFSDEAEGIESDQYALGFDIDAGLGHRFGAEVHLQKSDIPFGAENAVMQEAKLRRGQLFWNWSSKPWAVSASYHYEQSKYIHIDDAFGNIPSPLTTHRVPLQIRWFSESGLVVSATATYFEQDAEFDQLAEKADSHFTLLDAALRYSFLRKKAEVSLHCNNIFNQSFNYQSTSLFDRSPRIAMYIPERTVLLGVKFAY